MQFEGNVRSSFRITTLPGDGIGPEVTQAACRVVDAAADVFGFSVEWDEHAIGGAALDATGVPLPPRALKACLSSDAVLLGAVGGPAWDDATGNRRPESGLLQLRQALDVYANLRPVAVHPSQAEASPLRADRVAGVDLLVVRELTGGIYFGEPRALAEDEAFNTMRYRRSEIERVARVAFQWAQQRSGSVTSVDKANVLEVSQLWRRVVEEVHANEFPDVELQHLYVDNAAMQLVRDPRQFDVILTGNLFGDILSDLAATLPGSLGMLPSASLGGKVGLFEPVHGSAPDIAGQQIANPLATILSAAMMLDYLEQPDAAEAIRRAVQATLEAGYRTADLWHKGTSKVGTKAMSEAVAQALISAQEPATELP